MNNQPLTKEQFRAQFPQLSDLSEVKDLLHYENTTHGYKIYRCLNLLFLEDDGKFYGTNR